MTETKNTEKLPEPIPVDTKKLIDGIGTIFGGIVQILSAMEPQMAKELADMAINGVPKEKSGIENFNPNDFEEIIAADDLPWDTTPEQPTEQSKPKQQKAAPKTKKSEQATELTADDLIRVVTQKIKQNRTNREKALALIKSYGAAKVSDIPPDKYEAFLTDVSQL